MEMLEKIGNNPLLVSLITLIATTIIGALGYLIKKAIIDKEKNQNIRTTTQQSNIIQNFNSGITYREVREIAEEVVESKLNRIKKQ